MLGKPLSSQRFGQDVCWHLIGWTVDEIDSSVFYLVTDKVKPYIKMLGPGMIPTRLRQSNGGLIVFEQSGRTPIPWMTE